MTAVWVRACYAAMDAAAAGQDPVAALEAYPESVRDRALAPALTIIERVAWISEQILHTPNRRDRQTMLDRHTRETPGLRELVKTRVRRKWHHHQEHSRSEIEKLRGIVQ